MESLIATLAEKRGKLTIAALALGLLILITYFSFYLVKQQSPLSPQTAYLVFISLFAYLVPVVFSWMTYRMLSWTFCLPVTLIVSALVAIGSHELRLLGVIPIHLLFCYFIIHVDRQSDNRIIDSNVELEKLINQKNDLEVAYQERGTSISVFFEKYTSYYNLRNLANEFSATLSLNGLCQMVVTKTIELIRKGDWCLLLLSEPDGGTLSLMASKNLPDRSSMKMKDGDVFDFWILRNRQSLIVHDTQKDFRFDLKKTSELHDIRSLISSPIIYEGKPVGAVRLHSRYASNFSTEDLRILDAISTLASSAISNSILFQKTEELAIRDSLTGLYVQRHFLERLREEHRRSLLTNAPLSFLMCDLDHFKKCNDEHGHGVGDVVLSETSHILTSVAKDSIVARYGGEEFAILLPKRKRKEAAEVAEQICEKVRTKNLVVRRERIPVTISIGVAAFPEDTLDSEELIRVADERLYQAKRLGRDQVCAEK
jgi:diguanylate cyclase (GGDEF)-like protein